MSNTINSVDNAMITKIGNKIGSAKETVSSTGAFRNDASKPASTSGNAVPSDTVKLTSSGQLLERLEKSLATLPDIDASRVDAVKNAIANGDYEIDAERIADTLIRMDREFGA